MWPIYKGNPMADTVSTLTILNGPSRLTQKFLDKSDGTGEAGVVKVTIANFTGATQPPVVPAAFLIEKIVYAIAGGEVQILADGTTPILLATITGFGKLDYHHSAGLNTANTGVNGGGIKFTTVGFTATSTYDITLFMRKQG